MLLLALLQSTATLCGDTVPVATTVLEIRADPARFMDKCVRVTGFSDGRSLFARPDPLRRLLKSNRWTLPPGDEALQIGIYSLPERPRRLARIERKSGLRWTVTGIVDSCERIIERAERKIAKARAADPDEDSIVYASGYCHFWSGPVIFADHAVPARIR